MGRSALTTILVVIALLAAACGGTASPGPGGEGTPGIGEETPPDFTLPPFPGPGSEGQATFRLANLFVPKSGAPPELYLYGGGSPEPGDAPIARVAFGTVSDYQAIAPGPVTVSAGPLNEDDEDSNFTAFLDLEDGDQVTMGVHGYDNDGTILLSYFTIAELGSGVADQWPDVDPAKATFLIYPGALQWTGVEGADYAYFYVSGGDCLHSRADGGDDSTGFGGNVPEFYLVAPGTIELGATSDGCDGKPQIGPVKFGVAAGDRIAVIPYGQDKDLRLLVLPLPRS